MSDLNFDLSKSKVKCDRVIGLPIYGFLLMFNSNIRPNSAPLRDITCIRLQNLGDLEFDLSRSLKVICDSVIGLPICFPIDIYNNHMSNSHHLALIATQNVFFSYVLSLGPNYEKSQVHQITSK